MNLQHLIGDTKMKGVSNPQRRFYDWDRLKIKGDSLIFDAKGHSEMDTLQSSLGAVCRYREKKNRGEMYVTRRLKGNQIAIIKVR